MEQNELREIKDYGINFNRKTRNRTQEIKEDAQDLINAASKSAKATLKD